MLRHAPRVIAGSATAVDDVGQAARARPLQVTRVAMRRAGPQTTPGTLEADFTA
jgi:hypothetical protein